MLNYSDQVLYIRLQSSSAVPEFDLLGVFGLSTDSVFSHREFAKREGLEYPLLTDSDGSVADAYGVLYDEVRGHKRIAKRAVFLVDSTQAVRYSWCADDPSRQPDWAEIKAAIEDVKSD